MGDPERFFTVNSFSKTYAMTGWRVGYVVAPPRLAPTVVKLQEPVVACACSVSQAAAEAALRGPQSCVAEMVSSYRARRDLALGILREAGLYHHTPEGTFYLLVDLGKWEGDSLAFAKKLLKEENVAVAPGETFGRASGHMVRISFAVEERSLLEGMGRLCRYIRRQ
jgi:aspartate/methionine/tyrosine aminotransferase